MGNRLTMKAKFIYLLPIIGLTSCTKPNFYQQKINDIPTKTPNYNTELIFVNDSFPTKPYFEIVDFDIVEKGSMSKWEIQKRLEHEAIKEGVDAIIGIDYWSETEKKVNVVTVLLDLIDEDYETTTIPMSYTHITGRGIVYLENMNFIGDQKEFEYFYKIDPETDLPVPLFKIEYKLTGQVFTVYPETDDALDVYKRYFQFYSDFHLLKQRERWAYKMNGTLLKKRALKGRYRRTVKWCYPKYDEENRLVQLKIVHRLDKLDNNEFINYSYDEKGRILKRTVEKYDGALVIEDYKYDDQKLTARHITIKEPLKDPIKINTSIYYYHPDYLKDYYFNEYVKNQEN